MTGVKTQIKGIFFPVASTRNYVMLRDAITRPLTALTVRFWMRTNDTTISGTPFSYSAEARGGSSNELFVADYTNFSIRLNNAATGRTNVNATGGWHHMCFTWQSSDGSWALYKDGQAKVKRVGLKKGYELKSGGVFVLGQEQDSDGGGFQTTQSFIGEMTNVNLWSRDLTAEEILQLSSSCAKGNGDVMQWSHAVRQQTVVVQEISSDSCVLTPVVVNGRVL